MGDNKPKLTVSAVQEQLQKMKAAAATAARTEDSGNKLPVSPLIEAAAVLGLFDPDAVRPLSYGNSKLRSDPKMLNELIGWSDPVLAGPRQNLESPDNILFCLKKTVRRQALQQLLSEGRVADALYANSNLTYESNDPLQQMLTQTLTGELPPLGTLQPEQLRGLRQVCDWLYGIETLQLPDQKQIERRLEMAEMLVPFRHLTGVYRDGRFVEFFRGRHAELARLRKYVGVAPPQSANESIGRAVSGFIESVTSLKKKPPLLITGMGGAGKSTLLAKFILSHAEAHEEERFPFVYIDFDRPNISALEPETLLVEAARQLAVQYADEKSFCKAARDYYDEWNRENKLLEDAAYSESVTVRSSRTTTRMHSARLSMQSAFIQLFSHVPEFRRRPFLIVLDTFEEVQYKGEAYVAQLYHFMNQLQEQYPLLRTVVAGRAPIGQFKTDLMELGNLDHEAARGFLENACRTDAETAHAIVSKVGGNPLTLKLAAEFVNSNGVKALSETKLSQSHFILFEKQLPEIERQGILYRRILDHIHNPKVRNLANPGLALRYITPRLIKEVLNGPCGLDISTDEAAQALFGETAREVSLVNRIAPDTLQHRTDIRKVMLKLMNQSYPGKVAEIHRLAVQFYEKETALASKAEGFYHRLCLDEPAQELDKHWEEGIQQFLGGITDELPPRAQSYLVARTGNGYLDSSIWEQAEDDVKERWALRRAGDLLNAGLPDKAIEVIKKALSELPDSRGLLTVLMVRGLIELGKKMDAVNAIRSLLNSVVHATVSPHRPGLERLLNLLLKELDNHSSNGKKAKKDNGDDDNDLSADQEPDMVFKL
jgi:hypothetical protein